MRILLAMVATLLVTGSACMVDSGPSWADVDEDYRQQMCVEGMGVRTDDSACDCAVELLKDFFDTPDDFSESTEAPPGFETALRNCVR